MCSCLLACQGCPTVLDAVGLLKVCSKKVKELLELVPTSAVWHLNKQPRCLDVRAFSRGVLSSVRSQLLLLMGGNAGRAPTVRLFIWLCDSRHRSLGQQCPCYAVRRDPKLW